MPSQQVYVYLRMTQEPRSLAVQFDLASSCSLSIMALDQCSSLELSATITTDHKHLKCNYTTKEIHFNLISIV